MNRVEAKEILREKLKELRAKSYRELCTVIDHQECFEIQGKSGTVYQVEIGALWDDKAKGHLRVTASIDDGGWRAYFPMTENSILAPDGSFIGE